SLAAACVQTPATEECHYRPPTYCRKQKRPLKRGLFHCGAGDGNRTHVLSLGSSGPAIERRPQELGAFYRRLSYILLRFFDQRAAGRAPYVRDGPDSAHGDL